MKATSIIETWEEFKAPNNCLTKEKIEFRDRFLSLLRETRSIHETIETLSKEYEKDKEELEDIFSKYHESVNEDTIKNAGRIMESVTDKIGVFTTSPYSFFEDGILKYALQYVLFFNKDLEEDILNTKEEDKVSKLESLRTYSYKDYKLKEDYIIIDIENLEADPFDLVVVIADVMPKVSIKDIMELENKTCIISIGSKDSGNYILPFTQKYVDGISYCLVAFSVLKSILSNDKNKKELVNAVKAVTNIRKSLN